MPTKRPSVFVVEYLDQQGEATAIFASRDRRVADLMVESLPCRVTEVPFVEWGEPDLTVEDVVDGK